jgi:hypothetical protein
MQKIHCFIIGCATLVAVLVSCNTNKTSEGKSSEKTTTLSGTYVLSDSLVFAIVTHASENADPYENEEFKSFLHEKLIPYIFEQLYAEKLKAYDFLTDEELSLKEIKKIEATEGFSRSKVGKVQFNEQWYFDKNGVLNKRVNSMTLGVESYSNQGNFYGYKALFKIKFLPIAQ